MDKFVFDDLNWFRSEKRNNFVFTVVDWNIFCETCFLLQKVYQAISVQIIYEPLSNYA